MGWLAARRGAKGWAGGLGDGGPAAWEAQLAALGSGAYLVRTMLVALAWGRGSGLPRRDLWPAVATALIPAGVALPRVTDADTDWLLHRTGNLITTEGGPGGVAVCRLADGSLAAYLRGEAGEGPGAAGSRAASERRVTRALLATVPAAPGGRDWDSADPYVLAHLAGHAAAAGRETLAALLADWGFLAVADPAALLPLMDATDATLRQTSRVYRRAAPLLGGDSAANAACLAEAAHALEVPPGRDGAGMPLTRPRPAYRARLVSTRADDSVLTLTGHVGLVNDVACWRLPDGRQLLASAGDDRTVRLWDPAAGMQLGEPLTGSAGWVNTLAFGSARDGRLLLASVGQELMARVWDPLAGAPFTEPLAGHTDLVFSVAMGSAPDGRLIMATGSRDTTIRLWDPVIGTPLSEPLTGHTGTVNALAFGRVGGRKLLLASASADGTVRLWDPLAGTVIGDPMTEHEARVAAVEFGHARDGRLLLASGGLHTVRLWDPLTQLPIGGPLTGHQEIVTHLAFAAGADGRPLLVSVGRKDTDVRLWDPLTGVAAAAPLSLPTPATTVAAVTGRDGEVLLAVGCEDGAIRLYDPARSAPRVHRTGTHDRWVGGAAIARRDDGHHLVLSVGATGSVGVWDAEAGTPVGQPFSGHTGEAGAVAVIADGQRVLAATGGTDKTVRLWDVTAAAAVGEPLRGHTGQVRAVAFGSGPAGPVLASAGDDQTVRLWDPARGEAVGEPLTGHSDWVDAVAFSPTHGAGTGQAGWAASGERPLLASGGGDGTVRLWDTATGEPRGDALTGHRGAVRAVAFGAGPEGAPLLASAGDDATIRLWDPLTRTELGEPLAGHTNWVRAVTFTTAPDGRPLLVSGGGDKTVRIWDPVARTCLLSLRRGSPVRCLAADGLTVALGDDNGLAVIELDAIGLAAVAWAATVPRQPSAV